MILSGSPSYAPCMSAKSVSPPTSGTTRARRIEPSDGSGRHVTSLCQVFSLPRFPSSCWITRTSRCSWSFGVTGCTSRSPKYRPKSRCCSDVIAWSRKKSTLCSSRPARSVANVASSSVFAQIDVADLGADRRAQAVEGDPGHARGYAATGVGTKGAAHSQIVLREIFVDDRNADGTLTDCRGDALDRAVPNVADREHPGTLVSSNIGGRSSVHPDGSTPSRRGPRP